LVFGESVGEFRSTADVLYGLENWDSNRGGVVKLKVSDPKLPTGIQTASKELFGLRNQHSVKVSTGNFKNLDL
jgi:hypothetical protein